MKNETIIAEFILSIQNDYTYSENKIRKAISKMSEWDDCNKISKDEQYINHLYLNFLTQKLS